MDSRKYIMAYMRVALGIAITLIFQAHAHEWTDRDRSDFRAKIQQLNEDARDALFPLHVSEGSILLDFEKLKALKKSDLLPYRQPMLSQFIGYWNEWAEHLSMIVHRDTEYLESCGIHCYAGLSSQRSQFDIDRKKFLYESKFVTKEGRVRETLHVSMDPVAGLCIIVMHDFIGCKLEQPPEKLARLEFFKEDGGSQIVFAETTAGALSIDPEASERYFFNPLLSYNLKISDN